MPGSFPPWLSGIARFRLEDRMYDGHVCSAKGCTRTATVSILWNNPKIHSPERRKTWLACPDHEEHLREFLAARGFVREVVPLREGDGDSPGSA